MPPQITDDDHKRRARRRLIGGVALAIVAVIVLPLVLEDEPPPAGPLEISMPSPIAVEQKPPQSMIEQAPSSANTLEDPTQPLGETAKPGTKIVESEKAESEKAVTPKPQPPKLPVAPVERNPAAAETSIAYTVQVGVFADKVNVQKLQTRIAGLGFRSQTDEVSGSTRVRVGSFPSKEDAEKVAAKLAAAGIAGQVVEK